MDLERNHQTSIASQSSIGSHRLESYTEAVPLSLSSMAHASLPLEDGVLDGLRQVLSHTLLSCVNYARIVHPPHNWTFRDLTTSEYAWTAVKGQGPPRDLPFALTKLKFQHQYTKNALIYLKPALANGLALQDELNHLPNWSHQVGILGRVSLVYASKEQLTPAELSGQDTEDVPETILYKIVVEYRSLPPTGNQQAVQAEELSMLSFGGSVDDDVKYGALASLYDESAKYVLEIYSVRGKKYKFDLMDSTLSNGTVPQLSTNNGDSDPFVKALCVTVTDHTESLTNDDKYAITRIHLTLEGKPRQELKDLRPINYVPDALKDSFLLFNPNPPLSASSQSSGHLLLLDPEYAGRVYVNGRFVTTWGDDPRIGSHGVGLFGMDLQGIPFWHGRIVDFEVMKKSYAQLLQELLIDAKLMELQIARRLMYRLMTNRDPPDCITNDDMHDDEDRLLPPVTTDCLESQILSSATYDPVGIAAKAIATRFRMEFGQDAIPCLSHELSWARNALPNRAPKVVPSRLLSILRRGGYFSVQQTMDELWFAQTRSMNAYERQVVVLALQKLARAGCIDIKESNVTITDGSSLGDCISKKMVCRYHASADQYVIVDTFFGKNVSDLFSTESNGNADLQVKSELLGMYLAQVHPDGNILPRYLIASR